MEQRSHRGAEAQGAARGEDVLKRHPPPPRVEAADGDADDPQEIWRWFLVVMALALLIEGILILPKGADERVEIQRSATGKVSTEQAT